MLWYARRSVPVRCVVAAICRVVNAVTQLIAATIAVIVDALLARVSGRAGWLVWFVVVVAVAVPALARLGLCGVCTALRGTTAKPNVVFAAGCFVYYTAYRKLDREQILSNLFKQDKYGVVLLHWFCLALKYGPSGLEPHFLKMLGVLAIFFLSTGHPSSQGLLHLAAVALYAVGAAIAVVGRAGACQAHSLLAALYTCWNGMLPLEMAALACGVAFILMDSVTKMYQRQLSDTGSVASLLAVARNAAQAVATTRTYVTTGPTGTVVVQLGAPGRRVQQRRAALEGAAECKIAQILQMIAQQEDATFPAPDLYDMYVAIHTMMKRLSEVISEWQVNRAALEPRVGAPNARGDQVASTPAFQKLQRLQREVDEFAADVQRIMHELTARRRRHPTVSKRTVKMMAQATFVLETTCLACSI